MAFLVCDTGCRLDLLIEVYVLFYRLRCQETWLICAALLFSYIGLAMMPWEDSGNQAHKAAKILLRYSTELEKFLVSAQALKQLKSSRSLA